MKNKYFQLAVSGPEATLDIYGDITSWPWLESDVSAYNLSQRLAELDPSVTVINVNINSYGGEVAEGLAIYNALKRHPAQVRTRVDGFACSIASVIFMAGDERFMANASLLMIHNAWTYASGNAGELRKAADDMDTITSASKAAYLANVSISDEELTALMDAETWITPEDALAWGFATDVETTELSALPSQSARDAAFRAIIQHVSQGTPDDGLDVREPSLSLASEADVEDPDDDDETGETDTDGDGADVDGDDASDDDPDDGDDPSDDDDTDKEKQRAAFAAFMRQAAL